MTTPILNALKQVREAKTMVLNKLSDTTIPNEEKKILGDVLINLQDEEDILINSTLQDMVDKINASNAGLKELIQQMDNASQHISALSNTIKKISDVLSTLTDITNKAISAGLI